MWNLKAFVMYPYTSVGKPVALVSCDWLALSVMFSQAPKGVQWQLRDGWKMLPQSPTAVWAQRWFIMDADGNKVATVLCEPRSPIIDARRAVIEIANRWLYICNLEELVDYICNITPMAITGVNRIDLCCDFEMDESKWQVIRMLESSEAYVKALRQAVVWYQTLSVDDPVAGKRTMKVPHCLSWGGHASTFKWKVYYKWLELQQAQPESKKEYIVDMWRQGGLNPEVVWRCEVSITRANGLCRTDGSGLKPLDWFRERVRLWQDIFSDKFVVRMNEGHVDKRNDSVVTFLGVDGCKAIRHALPRGERAESDPEKRLTCKLWKELQQGDTQCSSLALAVTREALRQLVQCEGNMWVLQRVYGVGVEDVMKALENDMPS